MRRLLCTAAAFLLLGAQRIRFTDHADVDGDGIPDDADICASTPARAEAIANGCSAMEFIAHPELLGEPVNSAMEVAAAGIRLDLSDTYDKGAELMRRGIDAARVRFDAGLIQLAQGDPCGAAETIGSALDNLERLSSDSHELILATREILQREISPRDPRDGDFKEVAFHELGYRASLVGRALLATRVAHDVADKVCDQVVRPSRWTGIIERTDDAARMMELVNGTRLVVPVGADTTSLGEGARVRIQGTLLADRTGIAKDIGPIGRDGRSLSVRNIPLILLQCIKLQIAPFQPFNPPLPISPNYVLHDPRGYTGPFFGSPVLQLEAPMRLAAALTGACASQSSPTGKFNTFRYSLRLQYAPGSSTTFNEFASDLTPSDNPMWLPSTALPTGSAIATSGTLRVIEQVQSCIGGFRRRRCSSTFKELGTTDHTLFVLKGGEYASYQYFTALFDLDDGNPNDFRVAGVQSFTVHPLLSGHPVSFMAEGYSPSGVKVVRDVTSASPFFSIFHDDFFDPDQVAGFASTGTSQRSGLKWPRVVGARNGWIFWYSANLPFIVRDLVDTCNPGPHSFYRLPWAANVIKNVGQGNSSNFSHNIGSSQEFAFDFGLADGNSIRATRGGVVQWLTEAQTTNFNPNQPVSSSNQPFPMGSLQNWGNAVRIAHQDGTFSWYFHIKTNTVSVNVGQTVLRGQSIAQSDNTGRSTKAHLHYQVQDNNTNWGQSIQIRFDTQSHGSCYIPQTNDNVTSNNN